MAKGLLTDEEELRRFNAIEAQAQPWYARALPMEGRATFLPFRDSMPGSVFNQRELAVPGLIAEAANAITAPARSLLGTDPEFEAGKEGVNMAFNVMGGGLGSSRAMRNPTGEGGIDLAMSLFNTKGLPNKGADLIQNSAEALAQQLKDKGFQVSIEHSGSKAGPSSYLQIYDPETGRFINNVRLSGHSKGAVGSSNVLNIATPEEMQGLVQAALDMRSKGPSEGMLAIKKQQELAAKKRTSKGVKSALKTAQDEAMEIAQKNAALPIEQGGLGLPKNNTPMDRAKAMGFDIEAYHGTINPDIMVFDPMMGKGAREGTGSWFSENPQLASTYAGNMGGTVMPVLIKDRKFAVVDAEGKNWARLTPDTTIYHSNRTDTPASDLIENLFHDYTTTNDIARFAKREGDKGVRFFNIKDQGARMRGVDEIPETADNLTVFDPTMIRSRFAAFDPFKRNSGNILAGVGAGGVGLGLRSLLHDEEEAY